MKEVFLAFVGSFCAGVLYNIPKKYLIWTGLSGMIGWMAVMLSGNLAVQTTLATFVGAVVVGLYSEITARSLKTPATLFSVPGIFPLVPGIAAYNTVRSIVENQLDLAVKSAVETLGSAGAIAFGILLVTASFRIAGRLHAHD